MSASKVLVLGIGNLLWADEGFGVRAVEALHAGWQLPPSATLMDGGTQGLYLLEPVCESDHVLVFDAIDYGLPPGTLRVLRDAEIPQWSDTTMSLHQASFMELLSLARLRDRFPRRITLIGVQPAVLDDLGGSLSPLVRARVQEAVVLALAELAAWGFAAQVRSGPPEEALNASPLALADYEGGRPGADAACRVGDARFLNQVHGGA
ncbi:protein involved in processing of HyaA and HyaB proteins [Rubrivivax sp. A210]|uniref:HyaD/HybD family hydrogenase maturation endopeptidase n=1 Tax=Rubrivivax sp. A210 TaxID=2772301 RepID=UPI00191A3B2C|nr:HyaD/HybD family hydrogenase maturation endopeptidase [Rubrivivax sp. A210]CAD5375018.1 protein involved in processing of HyaA and HyaB proteins [Rubrivivax sp. A210]